MISDLWCDRGKPSSTKGMVLVGFLVCTGLIIAEQISQGIVRIDFIVAYLGLPYMNRQTSRSIDAWKETKIKKDEEQ